MEGNVINNLLENEQSLLSEINSLSSDIEHLMSKAGQEEKSLSQSVDKLNTFGLNGNKKFEKYNNTYNQIYQNYQQITQILQDIQSTINNIISYLNNLLQKEKADEFKSFNLSDIESYFSQQQQQFQKLASYLSSFEKVEQEYTKGTSVFMQHISLLEDLYNQVDKFSFNKNKMKTKYLKYLREVINSIINSEFITDKKKLDGFYTFHIILVKDLLSKYLENTSDETIDNIENNFLRTLDSQGKVDYKKIKDMSEDQIKEQIVEILKNTIGDKGDYLINYISS